MTSLVPFLLFLFVAQDVFKYPVAGDAAGALPIYSTFLFSAFI